jgi:hypothetical protein
MAAMQPSEISVHLPGSSRPLYELFLPGMLQFDGFAENAARMNGIDTLRNIDGRPARFLRASQSGLCRGLDRTYRARDPNSYLDRIANLVANER